MSDLLNEFREKQSELRNKAFTEELKNNALVVDVEFNNLQVEVDRTDIYKNGGILGVTVDLNEHNKSILSKFVKDSEAYNELLDIEFGTNKKENQTDLISIIDYLEKIHREYIHYDVEEENFYYQDPNDLH